MTKAPKIVTYLRVSTQKQGQSGLGLEAQRRAVADYIRNTGAIPIGEFTEIESGRSPDRPQLKAAIAKAKATRATLCVAKLDRVGRRASEVLTLLDRKDINVVFADSPHASQLQIGILAVVAEEEARAISARTKAALAAAKARGVKLGNPKGWAVLAAYQLTHGNGAAVEAAKRSADSFADDLRMYVEGYVAQGLSNRAIAAKLNEDEIAPRRTDARWHETSVRRVRERLSI